MKNVLPLAGLAIALSLTSATAFAADHHRGDRDRDHRNGPAVTNQDNHFNGNGNKKFKFNQPQHQQNNWQQNNTPQKNWQSNNGWKNGNNGWNNNGNWKSDNWSRYRSNQFAQKRFRLGAYHAPRGFNYRRWSFGQHLPFLFLSSSYFLPNAYAYGLFTPPPGLVWVRYGDDALLVDRYTGEIVQVRYNVFY